MRARWRQVVGLLPHSLAAWTLIRFATGADLSQNVSKGNTQLHIATRWSGLDAVNGILSREMEDDELRLNKRYADKLYRIRIRIDCNQEENGDWSLLSKYSSGAVLTRVNLLE
ncbi:hypothetical protein BDW66DRAFT_13979 [Aspergillus desertorum]